MFEHSSNTDTDTLLAKKEYKRLLAKSANMVH